MAASGATFVERLLDGSFFTRARVLSRVRTLLVLELLVVAFVVAGTHGAFTPVEPQSVDFISFYSAGTLAASGAPEAAYDPAAHYAEEQRNSLPGINYQFFFYPPVFLLLCRLFAPFSYLGAFALFQALTLPLYMLAFRRILGDADWRVLIPAIASPAVLWTLGLGQNAFLTAGLFGGGILLLERRPVLAGLLLGAVCYKPHFGLLIPVALAAGGHWRAFAGAAASVVLLVGASVLAFGTDTWVHYIATFLASGETYQAGKVAGFPALVTPYGGFRLIGLGHRAAMLIQVACGIGVAATVATIWRGGHSLAVRGAALTAGTLIAVPIALFYELVLGMLATAWLIRAAQAHGWLRWEKLLLGLAFLLPLFSLQLALLTHVPLNPMVPLILFGLTLAHARQERRAARRGAASVASDTGPRAGPALLPGRYAAAAAARWPAR